MGGTTGDIPDGFVLSRFLSVKNNADRDWLSVVS